MRYNVDARSGFFQCFRQNVASDWRARQENVEPAQMFPAADKLTERCKHTFRGRLRRNEVDVNVCFVKFIGSALADRANSDLVEICDLQSAIGETFE